MSLRQTLALALFLHAMLAGIAQWQPDLLWSVPIVPRADTARPLEFRFVDTPDTPLPEETPDTQVLSDRDREARDSFPRDDAEDPFSEGNSSQEVLRSVPSSPLPSEASESTPPVAAIPERPETTQPVAESNPAEDRTEEVVTETETTPETNSEAMTPLPELPPARPRLRNSMAQLNAFVEPEVYHNPDGGSDGQQGLVSFDTKGHDLGPYITEVLRIIERNWKSNIPAAARLPGMQGATFVELSIVRSRSEDGPEIAQIMVHQTWPSGKRSFDQAALFALQISSPLPPIPEHFPYDTLDGRIGFLYNLRRDQVTFPPRQ